MKTKKLLLIGFSCTDTHDGYAAFLKDKLAISHPEIEVQRCALGGLAPPIVSGTLRQILTPEAAFTHVLLEISTSIYSWLPTSTESQALNIVRDIIDTVVSNGAQPFFLMLNRVESRKQYIDFNNIIRSECILRDINYLDLCSNIDQIFGRSWYERHYRDEVHTNEAGGRSQAGVVYPSIVAFMNRRVPNDFQAPSPDKFATAISLAELTQNTPTGEFSRKNHTRPYLTIKENQIISIHFEKEQDILGISYVMGPWSGNFQLKIESSSGSQVVKVAGIDERSYYPRLGYRAVNGNETMTAKKIEIKITDRAENITLVKGQRENYPCEIRLVDIFTMNHNTSK